MLDLESARTMILTYKGENPESVLLAPLPEVNTSKSDSAGILYDLNIEYAVISKN